MGVCVWGKGRYVEGRLQCKAINPVQRQVTQPVW